MRRPLRTRIWFYKPEWYFGWYLDPTASILTRAKRILIPFYTGGDEYDWHTTCAGWSFTGRVIVATRPCPGTGGCAEYASENTVWPIPHDSEGSTS